MRNIYYKKLQAFIELIGLIYDVVKKFQKKTDRTLTIIKAILTYVAVNLQTTITNYKKITAIVYFPKLFSLSLRLNL